MQSPKQSATDLLFSIHARRDNVSMSGRNFWAEPAWRGRREKPTQVPHAPRFCAAAARTRSHHSGVNNNGSKRELPSWNAHCKLGISGGGAITVPLPRLPVIPKDMSLCLHDTSSLTTRGMLKIHLQGVGRRHHSFSAQAVVPLVIGYHYLYFHMHPSPVSYTHLTLPTICSV